jgi:cytidylate kinase
MANPAQSRWNTPAHNRLWPRALAKFQTMARPMRTHSLRTNHLWSMNIAIGLEKCTSFISTELQFEHPLPPPRKVAHRAVVTISRQSGCGADAVGGKLAAYLEAHAPDASYPWKIFDNNLVRNVLAEHKLPRRFARFMAEDRASELNDMVDELLGTHPPTDVLVQHTAETILRLAERGNVILIGRGATVITRNLPYALHVRLVASLEKRVEHVRRVRDIRKDAALELVLKEDRGRRRYLKKYFGANLDDPLLYHLVLNTDLVSYEEASRIIGDIVLKRHSFA